MSQNDPEVLRAEIARTRAELSDNVDTLTDTKNKKTTTERLEMKKFCPYCRKHHPHKETK